MIRRIILGLAGAVLVSGLNACKDSGDGSGIGPCVHYFEEPVLHLQTVTDVRTGTFIETVLLSGIRIDSLEADLQSLLIVSNRVAMLDTVLVGNPPCSFGIQHGMYTFFVSAAGYRDTTITVEAAYSVNEGGCPSRSTGGTRIDIRLEPAGMF